MIQERMQARNIESKHQQVEQAHAKKNRKLLRTIRTRSAASSSIPRQIWFAVAPGLAAATFPKLQAAIPVRTPRAGCTHKKEPGAAATNRYP
jgi:hypothetical protein